MSTKIFWVNNDHIMLQSRYVQVHIQEFFGARDFSWNQGTLINNHVQTRKKSLAEKNQQLFILETLN